MDQGQKQLARTRVQRLADYASYYPQRHSSEDSAQHEYKVELLYSYFVDSYCSGRYKRTFLTENESYDFIRRLKDVRVPTRYSPSNFDKSFLEEEEIARIVERAILLERMQAQE